MSYSRIEVYSKLSTLFRDIFDDESIVLEDHMTAKDITGWDSLMHVTLLNEIEDTFDIRIPMKDKYSLKNVGEIVDIIMRLI